jgi:hypothetical protein
MVMALKSGHAAGLDVGRGLVGAHAWLTRAWRASNPRWRALRDPLRDESDLAYAWTPITGDGGRGADLGTEQFFLDRSSDFGHLAAVGATCACFLGHQQGDPMLESLCNYVAKHQLPTRYPCNTYQLYYGTLALFQAGGPRWQQWNARVRDLLVRAQRDDGCFAGSWDVGDGRAFGAGVGRVLSTAYCCLSLEVYYRYLPVATKAAPGR